MLICKNRLFRRFLFFSMMFLIFSLFYNQFTYANESEKVEKMKDNTEHVRIQQKRIISSLKSIEDCLINQGTIKNE